MRSAHAGASRGHEPAGSARFWRGMGAALVIVLLGGCASLGPQTLQQSRLEYNEAVKSTTEEQLLLNIVRLRYTDTPSSMAVSAIAAQFERTHGVGLLPFFTAAGGDVNRSFTAILPQFQYGSADRPTISLTPQDDNEFTRKLFTPVPLEGIVYLVKTTWPLATVFRLYLENLNWIPNAQTASGPTPGEAPEFSDFRRGIEALQVLQDQGLVVFGMAERWEPVGPALSAARVSAVDILEAAKAGYDYRPVGQGGTLQLARKVSFPVMRISPTAANSPQFAEVRRIFRLKAGLQTYEITQESLTPFPQAYPATGVAVLDLETRSMLQTLYFISHGVEVPAPHLDQGLARKTRDANGQAFDWSQITGGLFAVRYQAGDERPKNARVAVPYRGYWFYIDERDQDTKATFALLVELSRLELGSAKGGMSPVLTLPIGAR